MLEEAMAKAKQACEQYLAASFHTKEDRVAAFEGVLKAANTALLATVFTAHLMKSESPMLEIYNGHKRHGLYKQVLKVSLGRDGRMVREDYITCAEGCHVYKAQHGDLTMKTFVELGLPTEDVVKNIMTFLEDPNSTLNNLGNGVMN
jgi:hypothetical protein